MDEEGKGIMRLKYRWIRHLFCKDVIWYYPDMMAFWSMRNKDFVLTCKECGHQKIAKGQVIQDAIDA